MKIIVKQYLQSLRERNELDAILPQILSELGFNVITRPSIGSRQYGVDVAAVGKGINKDSPNKLYLFSLKGGDLNRSDWDGGSVQDLRSSLNEIRDVYMENHIPKEYKHLNVVICVCMGGEMRETVLPNWASYTNKYSNSKLTFEMWNGDLVADLLIRTLLGREMLDEPLRFDFQKAVAMVDIPDVSYRYFKNLLEKLLLNKQARKPKEKLKALRQANICLWILYVWARDVDNFEAPFLCSEIAFMFAWNMVKDVSVNKSIEDKQLNDAFDHFFHLNHAISEAYLSEKIYPNTNKLHAISSAVNSSSSTDVSLKLFDTLGRIAMHGLWLHWLYERFVQVDDDSDFLKELSDKQTLALAHGIELIKNNPILLCPLRDDQVIEIGLFLVLAQKLNSIDFIGNWLNEMVERIYFTLFAGGKFPTCQTDYKFLVEHPKDRSDEYKSEACKGSILYPFLVTWLNKIGAKEARLKLVKVLNEEIPKCTHQVWFPDKSTDDRIWSGDLNHGQVLPGLPMSEDISGLLDMINGVVKENSEFKKISAISSELTPLYLLACRHYRMPIPPQLWFIS